VDVDGRRFIDFMCAWGPNYLGYRHPEVEEAVQRQLKAGRLPERPRENIPDVNSGVHSSNPLCSTIFSMTYGAALGQIPKLATA
jgi:glutamate-1-semialdehyde aminotransferase